jgi:hypothetical protein
MSGPLYWLRGMPEPSIAATQGRLPGRRGLAVTGAACNPVYHMVVLVMVPLPATVRLLLVPVSGLP